MQLQRRRALSDLINIVAHDKSANRMQHCKSGGVPYRCGQQPHRNSQQPSNDEDNNCNQYDWLGIPAMQCRFLFMW